MLTRMPQVLKGILKLTEFTEMDRNSVVRLESVHSLVMPVWTLHSKLKDEYKSSDIAYSVAKQMM